MASFVFFIVTTFQKWACHVTCIYKLAKNFISQDTLLNLGKSPNMSLIPALVQELLKMFVGGGGLKGPPGGIGLTFQVQEVPINISATKQNIFIKLEQLLIICIYSTL